MPTHARVLLVSPAFHGYWESIERALTSLGNTVVVHVYDDFSSLPLKLRNKVEFELPDRLAHGVGRSRFGRWATRNAREALRAARPDVVVAVRADDISVEFWDDVDELGAMPILWIYDELSRMNYRPADFTRFASVFSYSRADVDHLRNLGAVATYLPDAFDPDIPYHARQSEEVVFVGARYGRREPLLVHLHEAGVPVRAYGRQWSRHPYDRLRTWQWDRPGIPTHRDVPKSVAFGLLAGSAAALNVHEGQDGFTMRTFEAPGVGALQLIDRQDVAEFYDPGLEVLSFESADELVELCRRSLADPRWREAVGAAGRRRTLAEHTFERRLERLVELWR
jgi:spore maturation protein CgeB